MEFLNNALVKQFKHNLAETYKDEINVKVKDFKKTFKENGYIILRPTDYIKQKIADLEIIKENNLNDDQIQNICTEIAIDRYIGAIRQSVKDTKIENDHQHKYRRKYALYEMYDRNNDFLVIILPYDVIKELPSPYNIYMATSNSPQKSTKNIKIDVENANEEIKKIFLTISLHTNLYIQTPEPPLSIFSNKRHEPVIKTGYLSLHPLGKQTVELLDEKGEIINPAHYIPLDLLKVCQGRTMVN